ncbi:MAG: sugar ABC transporter substrate-binding protein [Spirochaetales bacterium]|nr:sugar ABC transporter substrate-binding protein [Spirochaetales bacterium]
MKKLRFLFVLIVCLSVMAPIFAGGEQEAEYDYVLGKIPYTFEHAYHQAACQELTEYALKMYNAKVIVVDGESSNEKTLSAVENLVAQGVDAIELHCGDAGLMTTAINIAHEAGIPIVTTLIRPTEKMAPHIQPQETPSSFTMGQVAAEKWLEANPGTKISVAMLNFGGIEQIWDMRTGAFFNGVKSVDPNAVLVNMLNGQGSSVKSMEVTLDILQANPEVNIIFAANDEMALGALSACEQLGRGKMDNGTPLTEVIAGLDGSEAAMLKIYDPSSSFKMTHGAVRDVARAEADTMIAMIKGEIAYDVYFETKVLSPVTDFWNTPISEAQRFLEQNFFYTGDLAAAVAK